MRQPRTQGDEPTRRGLKALLPSACAASIIVAGALLPRGRPLGDIELCVVKSATGVSCPSCGITRSIVELSHGHLADSVRFHPLGPALFLVLAAIVAFPVLPGGLRDRLTRLSRSPAAAMACAATIVAVWAMRLWLGMLPS